MYTVYIQLHADVLWRILRVVDLQSMEISQHRQVVLDDLGLPFSQWVDKKGNILAGNHRFSLKPIN